MSSRILYERGRREPPRRHIEYLREPLATPAPRAQRLSVLGPPESFAAGPATDAMRALHGTRVTALLEVAASAEGVEVSVVGESSELPVLERALRGAAPTWAVEPMRLPRRPEAPLRLACPLGTPARPDWAPLRGAESFGDADPLASLLEAVQPLRAGERLTLGYLIRSADPGRRSRAQRELTQPAPADGVVGMIGLLLETGPQVPRFEPRLQRSLEERLCEPAFEVAGAAVIAGSDQARLMSFARSLSAAFASRFDCGFGGIALQSWRWRAGPEDPSAIWREGGQSLYLTVGELAALWHPPSSRVLTPGVSHLRRPAMPLPLAVARAQGPLLGVHRERGRDLPVRLPRADLDAGHLMVIGRTGVGKSTIVHQIIRQLMAASDRPAVGMVDPHGDLERDVALCSIPPGRLPDVALLELGDAEWPVGLPLFWAPPGVPQEAHVQTTFAAIRLIFREHWSPTRMEDAVFALTATLCQLPSATLLDAPRLFTDPIFRRQAVARLDDPVALQFWADYEALSEAGQRELARPVLYRLRAFYRTPAVRNLVCQAKGVDFRELMERGRIVLVSLSGSAIQAEADLLGELIIARLHLAALARLDQPPETRRRFYLAVDESQRFRGASLPILLSEGRKLGLTLVLSTQFLDAWGEALAQSVLGNVGTLLAFRCGPSDSRLLAASLRPYTPDQLEDLDRYEAIAKLQVEGNTQPAFDFTTLPVTAPADEATLAYIRAHTRRLYARPRREVEAELAARDASRPGAQRGHDVDEE